MKKSDEIRDHNSCLNRAADDEPLFVLRAKDPCAIATVLAWINFRVATGKNKNDDPELAEALQWANDVAAWRKAQERTEQDFQRSLDGDVMDWDGGTPRS